MLIRSFLRVRKTFMAAAATTLLAGAFQTGGCTINVDESLLQSLSGLLENVGGLRRGPGSGPHNMDDHNVDPGNMNS